ncbi:MAG: substrate-binding domain-containing protein, partial [Oscillospiraceae bacterium]
MKIIRRILAAVLSAGIAASATGCTALNGIAGGETLRILSGSENAALEQILEDCEKSTGVKIEMTYKGSVDIMQELKNGAPEYDAVWTASSLWISLGDEKHIVKHDESVCTSSVIFGIKQSVAEELGFTSGDVSVRDILSAIEDEKLKFCMTSATQSNSGASAYIGFLNALLGKNSVLTNDDLADQKLREQIKTLLSGVERSSGSSGWLEEMFLCGDYDAMVKSYDEKETAAAIFAGIIAAGLFLLLLFAAKWNFFISLGLAAAAYAGFSLLFRPVKKLGGIDADSIDGGEELLKRLETAQEGFLKIEGSLRQICD